MFSAYFTKLQRYSTVRFILEIAALTVISRYFIVVPVVIVLTILGVDTGTPNMDVYKVGREPVGLFFDLIIIGPFLETWLFQWLPLKLFSLLKLPEYIRIWLTTIIFALLHLDTGLVNFIGTVPIGYLLAWAYVVRQNQAKRAFWVVFVIHALTNLFPFLIYLLEFYSGV